jgi:fructoselysine-6-P-deglycase FrlB-like protein
MSHLSDEIASQPEVWSAAIARAASVQAAEALPVPGERVAVIGCGSSLNVARAYARLREAAGHGLTDGYPASELLPTRDYDRMVFISRTGTTTEVLAALREIPSNVRTTSLTATESAPLARETSNLMLLDFAAERSVVSSRFITATIVLLRAHLGEDLSGLPAAAAAELARPLPAELARPLPAGLAERTEYTFLGCGWASFVADEAALKLREASRTWAESYPAMEYRHGPISVSDPGTVVWGIGDIPASLAADAERTGATVVNRGGDPLLGLLGAQRLAVMLADRKGIDPDQPRSLSRSVILA